MNLVNFLAYLFMAFLTFPGFALAGLDWKPAQDDSNKVEFKATGTPGFIKINGSGGKVDGVITEMEGKVYGVLEIPMAGFTTGLDMRDDHMRNKYLDVAKFPKATFVLDPVQPNGTGFPISGKMTIKGDTANVKGTAKADTQRPERQLITAQLELSMRDFKSIGIPTWMGVSVADKVVVEISFLAVHKT